MSLRRTLRVHPEWWAAVLAVAAWPAALSGGGEHPVIVGHQHDAAATAVLTGLPHWAVMCVAMMVPITLPAVRHVGRNSLRRRRTRATAEFLLGYLIVWLLFGAAALAVGTALTELAPALIAAALLWPFTPWHRRLRGWCHRTVPLPPRGLRAARADVRFGLQHGAACVGTCAPAMLAMVVPWHDGPLPMLAAALVVAAARFLPARYLRPPRMLLRLWRSVLRSVRAPSPPPRRDPSAGPWSPGLRGGAA